MNPNATNHPIAYFKKFYVDGLLDLSPSFQRKPVWTDAQASYLIDTILNELPIPEIYVRSITNSEGETILEVVDGQQRLRSIIRFFSNELELRGDGVTPKWEGATWESLKEQQREEFWSYKIVTRELEKASDTEVRDIFRRLNANQSSLNDQELRHSQYQGQFISVIERLAEDRWWLDNKIVNPGDVRRMKDAEFVSELLIALIRGPLDKKKGLDDYYHDYDEDFPDGETWEVLFRDVMVKSKKIVGGDLRGWTSKTEYYSLFVAVGELVYEEIFPAGKDLERAQELLKRFRSDVNLAKRRNNEDQYHDVVMKYVDAVSRASTDIGRRIHRIQTIRELVLGESDYS